MAVRCQVLAVSRSGFDAYLQRQAAAPIDREAVELVARVQAIAAQTGPSDGSRRRATQLQAEGFQVGRGKARRLMQEAAVVGRRPTPRRPLPTPSRHGYGMAPTLLARQFAVEKPDQAWVGELTYGWTAEGWLYVAVLFELYARKVVGWAMSAPIDAALGQAALLMALGRRQPAPGFLHHTDRGSPYAGQAYQGRLAAPGLRCRMRRKGECLDKAVAARFFGSLKGERTAYRAYATRQDARADIMEYIEMVYNSTRLPSYLGYRSPNDYEALLKVA